MEKFKTPEEIESIARKIAYSTTVDLRKHITVALEETQDFIAKQATEIINLRQENVKAEEGCSEKLKMEEAISLRNSLYDTQTALRKLQESYNAAQNAQAESLREILALRDQVQRREQSLRVAKDLNKKQRSLIEKLETDLRAKNQQLAHADFAEEATIALQSGSSSPQIHSSSSTAGSDLTNHRSFPNSAEFLTNLLYSGFWLNFHFEWEDDKFFKAVKGELEKFLPEGEKRKVMTFIQDNAPKGAKATSWLFLEMGKQNGTMKPLTFRAKTVDEIVQQVNNHLKQYGGFNV